jgi:hypothetical protein
MKVSLRFVREDVMPLMPRREKFLLMEIFFYALVNITA